MNSWKNTLNVVKTGLAAAIFSGFAAISLHAQTLPDSANLELWLKADAGVTTVGSNLVSAWADQSGNGNSVAEGTTALQPQYVSSAINGLPAISYSYAEGSVGNVLQNTASNLNIADGAARTVFIVAQQTGSVVGTPGNLFTFRTSGPVMALSQFNLGGVWYIYSDGVTVAESTASQASTIQSPFIVNYAYTGSGTLAEQMNGTSLTVSGGNVASDTGATGFTIGNREDTALTNYGWQGYIGEVIVYNTALSPTNITAVDTYLTDKWVTPVPEPTSLALLALGGLLLLFRLRKKLI